MDLGQMRRGVDMGPSAVRYAGLYEKLCAQGYTVEDAGNISVPIRDQNSVRAHYQDSPAGEPPGAMRHLPEVISACSEIYAVSRAGAERGEFTIFLGGDHSIAIGTVGGATAPAAGGTVGGATAPAAGGTVGLLWIDAHADFNTPTTTPSGNIHGMPVAVLTGRGHPELVNLGHPGPKLQARDIVMIGIRDLDPNERTALAQSGIVVYTMRDVDELGMATVARRALGRLSHADRIHLSYDMDSMDPAMVPGVGTPVPGGITFREAHLLMEILSESGKIGSLDIVEVNPIIDAGNRTAELAVELALSLLGKRIL
jgi:arginase